MSDYHKTKAWREANPEKYREWQREYMRSYMRARRQFAKAAPPVDAVAGRPLLPGPVTGPVGRVETLPPVKAPMGNTAKLAELLARGRATVGQGPAASPSPAVKARVPAEWRDWSVERRRHWLKVNRLDLTHGEDCEERIAEWVEAG